MQKYYQERDEQRRSKSERKMSIQKGRTDAQRELRKQLQDMKNGVFEFDEDDEGYFGYENA